MSQVRDRRIQAVVLFLMAIVALLFMTQTALADDEVLQGDTLASGETVENDVLLNGTDVALNGTVAGDVLAVGRSVVINGDVQGSMFVLAENVVLNGQVEGSVYSIAVSFNMLSGSSIGRSLYFLGISLVTEKESEISSDLTAVTLGARLAGSVGRNTKAIIGLLEIGRLIIDQVNEVTTGKPLPAIETSSAIPQKRSTTVLAASIGPGGNSRSSYRAMGQEDQPAKDPQQKDGVTSSFGDWLIGRLRELVTYLLIGGLLIWLFPNLLENWANQIRRKPLAAGGWGLVAYVVGFVAHLILFLLILVVGISFAVVTLWSLAWAWWGVGFSALALTFSLFLVAIAFISKIIMAYLFGKLIFERFTSRADMRKPWPLLVGLIIYVLLCGIPYLGWAISLIVTFLGLGAIWLSYTQRNDRGREVEASATSI
jgi:hypothetical protein